MMSSASKSVLCGTRTPLLRASASKRLLALKRDKLGAYKRQAHTHIHTGMSEQASVPSAFTQPTGTAPPTPGQVGICHILAACIA
jgi:hypothetical protein